MRSPVNERRLREFMQEVAAHARESGRIYLTGGASAVLQHWRESTVDIDLKIVPENDRILRALPELKEKLHINVELASPSDFVPELPSWEDRSAFIAQHGPIAFHHYDFYSQALSKLERGHRKDLADVDAMVRTGLVKPADLLALFEQVTAKLYRYPAINADTLRSAVERFAARG
jgi:hypothetical protein